MIRVFPRQTKWTPTDELAFVGEPGLFLPPVQPVRVSVAFTWDIPEGERLARAWGSYYPDVQIGGPAFGDPGGEFVPGRFVKTGVTITSRGCPNSCWFCNVWRREGQEVRELPITDGWNLLDDNLLACSEDHQRAVFAMLKRNKKAGPVQFTGGLEAKRLEPWHVEALRDLKPKQMFFAYDTPDDLEPLQRAGRMLLDAGFTTTSHALRAYVLCGWPTDTIEAAARRMTQAMEAGFLPMAMLYRDNSGRRDPVWQKWGRQWARPSIAASKVEKL